MSDLDELFTERRDFEGGHADIITLDNDQMRVVRMKLGKRTTDQAKFHRVGDSLVMMKHLAGTEHEHDQSDHAGGRGGEDNVPNIVNLTDGLQIDRADLPQIASADRPEFMAWLQDQGVGIIETQPDAESLKPTQSQVNQDKIDEMIAAHEAGEFDVTAKPVLVSGDGYLIDGHHRWAAAKELGLTMNAETVGLPAIELLDRIDQFPKSFREGIEANRAAVVPAMEIPLPTSDADWPEFFEAVQKTPEFQEVTARLDELEKQTTSGNVTMWSVEKHSVPVNESDDERRYSTQRAMLHDEIERNMLPAETRAKPGEKPQAVLLMGPPGAGKSFAGVPYANQMGIPFAELNNDEIKAQLPEYEGWNAAVVHEESASLLEKRIIHKAVRDQHHFILDGVGKNEEKMNKIAARLTSEGYDVHAILVTIPAVESAGRAWRRFAGNAFAQNDPTGSPGRYVPLDYIVDAVGQKPEETYESLKNSENLSTWVSVSTNVPMGDAPIVLDQGRSESWLPTATTKSHVTNRSYPNMADWPTRWRNVKRTQS